MLADGCVNRPILVSSIFENPEKLTLAQIQYIISEINSGTLIHADSREHVTLKARLCGILTAGISGITTHVHGFYTFHFINIKINPLPSHTKIQPKF